MLTTVKSVNNGRGRLRDSKSVISYCNYLIMKGQLIGNFRFDGHRPTLEEKYIAEQCRRMSDKISLTLDFCKLNEIPDLLNYFDITYRIGYKCPPDNTFINKHKRRAFKAWRTGDRTIEESSVYGMIMPEVAYHPENADREFFQAYHTLRDKWITTLERFDRFSDTTSYENYQRLALMMRENIDSEFGDKSEGIKCKWYDRNKIDDLSNVSSLILRSYRRFTSSLFPGVFDYQTQLKLDNRILSELSSRSDLHPYDREAFALALVHNKHMV